MILVTVGSILPFDRLIRAMDVWASARSDTTVFAQIGNGAYEPRFMEWVRITTPDEFRPLEEKATVIVAHAGMGSIIESAEIGKPIVIMPRRFALKEHNTDHQFHTAKKFLGRPGVYVALDEHELPARIEEAQAAGGARNLLSKTAPADFVQRIRDFLTRA